MAVATAIILAAGRGIRMGSDYRDRPKGLIACGGTTLVGRSLAFLRAAGIRRTIIVTGHCADLYEDLARRSGGTVTTLYNERYGDHGSLMSLTLALAAVDEPCIVLDSDIVYEGRGLTGLLACDGENAALVSGTTNSGDEYYAWADAVEDQHLMAVRRLSKILDDEPDPPIGEHVGIVTIGRRLAERIRRAATAKIAAHPMAFYEDCLIEQLAGCPMAVVKIDDLVWCEIDDQRMLEWAQRDIFPRLDPVPART